MRIVVKVGTSTLAYPTGRLNIQRMERLCKTLSDLKNAGHEIILVSSGAIAMGFGKLNLSERPKDMPGKQASAAVGQCELMYVYDKLFTEYNHIVGQLLHHRAGHRRRRQPEGELPTTRWTACWSWARCPSSTRTTPSPPRRSPWATMTRSPPSSPPPSPRTCSCCSQTSTASTTATRAKTLTRSLSPPWRLSTSASSPSAAAAVRALARAAWRPSSWRRRSLSAQAAKWSSPTAKSRSFCMISSRASPSAPAFWSRR